jgi:chromosome segregation ATPase
MAAQRLSIIEGDLKATLEAAKSKAAKAASLQAEVEAAKKTLIAKEAEIDLLKEQQKAAIEDLKLKQEAAIESLKQGNAAQDDAIQQLREKQEAAILELEQKHEKEMVPLKEGLELQQNSLGELEMRLNKVDGVLCDVDAALAAKQGELNVAQAELIKLQEGLAEAKLGDEKCREMREFVASELLRMLKPDTGPERKRRPTRGGGRR